MVRLLLLTCVAGVFVTPAAAADPPKKLNPKQRAKLVAQWEQLTAEAVKAYRDGDAEEAGPKVEEAMRLARRLYPTAEFPDGHEHLAQSLANLGSLRREQRKGEEAERLLTEAVAMRAKLYPEQNHFNVALGLKVLADFLVDQGRPAEAEPLFRKALGVHHRIHGDRDHEHVVIATTHLGFILGQLGRLAEAERLLREALGMSERIDPKRQSENTAHCLNDLAVVFSKRGKQADAEQAYREALKVIRAVHRDRDHPDVATACNNLAHTLFERGQMAEAAKLYQSAIDMHERMRPKADHPSVVISLNGLGLIARLDDRASDAERFHRRALDMARRLYPKQDHPAIANGLNLYAQSLLARNQWEAAEQALRDSLDMYKRIFPRADHPSVAMTTNNLAHVLLDRGKPADAEEFYRLALDAHRQLHPGQDHPDVVTGLSNLAAVRRVREHFAEADELHREALAMHRRLVAGRSLILPEGEALTLAATSPRYRDAYLSNTFQLNAPASAVFNTLWSDKGCVTRAYERRQIQARAAVADPKAAKLLAELADARVRRAEVLVALATNDPETHKQREKELKAFEKTIAETEKELRPLLPAVERAEKLTKATPTDLQKALPADSAVVDFLRWIHIEFDPKKPGKDGEKRTPKYLAFVVTKTDVKLVDLGPADAIEKAVGLWREAIQDSRFEVPADLGVEVRKLVWEKVRKELPQGVKEVFISPDAALCRLPWVALPGDQPGTVLLEDEFAVATIPHAPFLLDHLWERDKSIKEKAEVLVVGGVDFDAKLGAKVDPKAKAVDLLRDAKAKPWPTLPASAGEAEALAKLAGERKWATTALTGDRATAAAVLAALPKAKHAHLATHGFFADAKFRSAFQLDEKDYQISLRGERVGRAANSPLVMTGLVLAGANDPAAPGRGVVTGESLIDLNLSGLELAVLSACDTGLGDVAGGEGTFGLQRAFHLAGTRNVVAGLWSVPDAATAALMGEFYRHLWEKQQSPVHALKAAQLAVYRTERAKHEGLRLRGFKDSGVKAVDPKAYPPNKTTDGTVRNHPALWAAFSLSGPGR